MGTQKFFETIQFKKLQKSWYQKLTKKGFEDHEKLVGSSLYLVQAHNYPYRHHQKEQSEAKLNYYILVGQHVEYEEFVCKRDLLIMTFVSAGMKIKEIGIELDKNGFGCHRQTIRFIIRRFETKWKIREWQKKQMTSNLVIK